ncbi:MAG: GNAT family N-acetyltransferase [Lachnospiraceae bacterium]|nr:GNAT family N-acetyltransferase [Lachnospiraceae bacterium]
MIIDSNMQIPFHPIDLDDMWWYKAREKEDDVQACDSIFGSIFLWSKAYYTEVAKIAGCAVARYFIQGQQVYSYPMGGTDENRQQAVEILLKLTHAKSEKLWLSVFSESQKTHIKKYFPGIFEIDGIRDRYDYVYETERLATLKGKKLSAKRNHINRFIEKYEWSYERITYTNKELCWEMEQNWFDLHMQESGVEKRELEAEKQAIRTALDYFEELNFTGGILKADGKVVAFTIGEQLNEDTMVVHFEKAYPDMQGAFQMINREFAANNCKGMKYINREEDTGDPGLRKAKLSYYPDLFAKKYYAIESDITYASKEDEEQIVELWKECFGDEERYIRFYLNNRFTEDNMLCIRENGKIVSMASFLPAKLKCPVESKDISMQSAEVLYVYAVATGFEFRNKGYAAKIIQHAIHKWKKPLILQHASESLETYYEKQGFVTCFKRYLYDFAAENLLPGRVDTHGEFEIIRDFTKEVIRDYEEKRNAFFDGRMYASWDYEALSYALKENAFVGGYLVKAKQGYLLCRAEEGVVRIVESLIHFDELKSDFWQGVLQELCQKDNCHILWAHNRGGMILPTKECAEIIENSSKKGYLGLTLD